ncbi:cell division protein FtsA [Oceanobacillus piezotolerans]|uniref:Cell division protein FtsA n=1 Tax=Oceanobacillus piezotolerans TaxID=2448030 RepID=A0A498D9M0_9BACI|nr:cell division protein FtsA [Oceanobacillus piezotolerans]RLL47804.1 cell division protein FtsA [Oceanobacillus piezotolerans]
MDNLTFALDIGTRSVTGIILEKQDNNTYSVNNYCTKEHKDRSMRDGQIHHVVKVAEVIQEVKDELENRSGTTLDSVCVAAAGRALKTMEASAHIELNQKPITEIETIKHLELSAVQAAQEKLANQEDAGNYTNYYCVGYSVVYYKLDSEKIGSLLDQSGKEASVEVIATFLPKVVVESLLAALSHAGLEMDALTLEPIAAIQVLIPESIRRLNVALVDIGAGTSDIAITDKGTVVAYGMVPVAGDEITEAISDTYLLDFPIAEKVKREIVEHGQAITEDILGFETTITYNKLIEDIRKPVKQLSKQIANEIIKLNGSKSPKAVMLIGGGSLTPEINNVLAKKLDLTDNRVAIRGLDAIQSLKQSDRMPKGPEFVTPIGIAIAAKENPVHYITVNVNGMLIRLFEMKTLTVGDCLVQAGIELQKWYGKPGMAQIITVNGKEVTLPGEFGEPPTIQLNGEHAQVDTFITSGDEITITKGQDGNGASVTLFELIGEMPTTTIFYNNKETNLTTKVFVNNEKAEMNYIVKDNDTINFHQVKTLQHFLEEVSVPPISNAFAIYVNNKEVHLPMAETGIFVNNKKVSLDYVLRHHDRVTVNSAKSPMVKDVIIQLKDSCWKTATVTFNGQLIQLKQPLYRMTRNSQELDFASQVYMNDQLQIEEITEQPFIFQDVFRYVDIDLTNVNGSFHILKNKEATSFDAIIQTGDELEITWDMN